jgi:hypothetical protein
MNDKKRNGEKMTEYVFEIKGIVKVKLQGSDTEENYQEAVDEVVRQAKSEIDESWIVDVTVNEYENETEGVYA